MLDKNTDFENPYLLSKADMSTIFPVPSISIGDVQLLKRSLIGFGLVGFLSPVLFAFFSDAIGLDVVALGIGLVGAHLTNRSFKTFPWTALFCSMYPLIFLVICLFPDIGVSIENEGPHFLLYFVLAIWSSINIVLIIRFHLLQRGQARRVSDVSALGN